MANWLENNKKDPEFMALLGCENVIESFLNRIHFYAEEMELNRDDIDRITGFGIEKIEKIMNREVELTFVDAIKLADCVGYDFKILLRRKE